MANLKPWEIIILVVVVLILFGSKRLPDAARGLGRSLRIFKAETKGLVEGEEGDKAQGQAAAVTAEQVAPAVAPVQPTVQPGVPSPPTASAAPVPAPPPPAAPSAGSAPQPPIGGSSV